MDNHPTRFCQSSRKLYNTLLWKLWPIYFEDLRIILSNYPQQTVGLPHLINRLPRPIHLLTIAGHRYNIPSGYLTQPWKITIFKFGKPSINGPFSMAMLNNQRVTKHKHIKNQPFTHSCDIALSSLLVESHPVINWL